MLADRILVLDRNPAHIRADFRIPLKQPRDHKSAEFLVYVDYIYKLMTQPQLEPSLPSAAARPAKAPYPMLPHARPGGIAGLLELLNDRGGKDDLYRVADELSMEVNDLLPIIEAASLLDFARTEKGDVEITAKGREFVDADIPTRKDLFPRSRPCPRAAASADSETASRASPTAPCLWNFSATSWTSIFPKRKRSGKSTRRCIGDATGKSFLTIPKPTSCFCTGLNTWEIRTGPRCTRR